MIEERNEGGDCFYQRTDVNANAVAGMARFVGGRQRRGPDLLFRGARGQGRARGFPGQRGTHDGDIRYQGFRPFAGDWPHLLGPDGPLVVDPTRSGRARQLDWILDDRGGGLERT